MKNVLFIFTVLFFLILLPQSVYSQGVNVTFVEPPESFSVTNGSTIKLVARAENETAGGLVNGTLCVTYNVDEGKGLCCSPSFGGLIECEILNVPVTFGTQYWNANFTDAPTSTVYYTNETRSYIGIYTDRTLIPIYPINNETVIGDNTNFIVNYTVDVYLPYDLTYNLYIHFFGYSSYLGNPLYSSEKKICSIEVSANETNPIPSGLHRYTCENYMYDSYYINYEELPNYKFWSAQLKILDNDVIGANLLSDTGYQDYMYQINTNLAHIHPPDEALYCHARYYYYNNTLYDLKILCDNNFWKDKFISFYSYLRDDGCGGGNLIWRYRNAVNSSEYGQVSLLSMPNNTEDYFDVGIVMNIDFTNTTYYGTNLNFTVIHLIHNWTYTCVNTTTYQTGNNDFRYIIGIGGTIIPPSVTVGYPQYPLPIINKSAVMPTYAVYWGQFFNTDFSGGLMLIALFFILAMTILVTLNSDVIGGGSIAIFGTNVFTRLGYINIVVMFVMLVLSGFVVVYIVRKTILSK